MTPFFTIPDCNLNLRSGLYLFVFGGRPVYSGKGRLPYVWFERLSVRASILSEQCVFIVIDIIKMCDYYGWAPAGSLFAAEFIADKHPRFLLSILDVGLATNSGVAECPVLPKNT